MPPDYGKLPLPEKSEIKNISDQNKMILKQLIGNERKNLKMQVKKFKNF